MSSHEIYLYKLAQCVNRWCLRTLKGLEPKLCSLLYQDLGLQFVPHCQKLTASIRSFYNSLELQLFYYWNNGEPVFPTKMIPAHSLFVLTESMARASYYILKHSCEHLIDCIQGCSKSKICKICKYWMEPIIPIPWPKDTNKHVE